MKCSLLVRLGVDLVTARPRLFLISLRVAMARWSFILCGLVPEVIEFSRGAGRIGQIRSARRDADPFGDPILARGRDPVLTRTELPGEPADAQSRYVEAAVDGVIVASLYAPNGNPRPGR